MTQITKLDNLSGQDRREQTETIKLKLSEKEAQHYNELNTYERLAYLVKGCEICEAFSKD